MQTVIPALRITDYERTKLFYEALGFSIDWEHRFGPDAPVFMQMSRGEQSLYLSQHAGDCQVGGLVYFDVPDVDAWYAQINREVVEIPHPPENKPWGNRELRFHDPDGNTLCICASL